MNSQSLSVVISKCPFCHDDVRGEDAKWGCGQCTAWHHLDCMQANAARCAACHTSNTALQKADTCLLASSKKIESALDYALSYHKEKLNDEVDRKNLAEELRILENLLLQKVVTKDDLYNFIYPSFPGFIYSSKVQHLASVEPGPSHFVIFFTFEGRASNSAGPTFDATTKTYRSLHTLKFQAAPHLDSHLSLIKINYRKVSDLRDPFNSGKNLPIVAHSENDYHFLIQLLHDLLSLDSLSSVSSKLDL